MIEMQQLDKSEDKDPNELIKQSNNQDMSSQNTKQKKIIILSIVSVIILLVVLIIILCVCLSGNEEDDTEDKTEEEIPDMMHISLEVNSDSDNKEVSFLSDEFNEGQSNLRNLEENQILFIDGKKYPFSKSMKLAKGKHKIILLFNETITSCQNMFKNCKDIERIYFNVTNECNNLDHMFSGCSSLKTINLEELNTSLANSMESLFNGCSDLQNINLGNFRTNSVINMKEMFNGCKSLKSIDLHSFDTSSVTNMERMFSDCNSLEEINLNNFNTSSVNNMNEMFNECTKAKKIDIKSFDTFLVENMYHIFYGCNSLENIDVSNFILYKLKNQIKDLFGNIENNSMQMKLYNTLTKIKSEENIIKDVDINIVMEIKLLSNDETDKNYGTKVTSIINQNQINHSLNQ